MVQNLAKTKKLCLLSSLYYYKLYILPYAGQYYLTSPKALKK